MDKSAYLRNAVFITVWYTSSTVLSLYNKQLFGKEYLDFKAPAAATCVHCITQFACAWLAIHVVLRKQFEAFRASFSFRDWRSGYLRYALPTAAAAAADVALSNTSLGYISITTYVLVKNSAPIFVLLSSWLLGLERITPKLLVIMATILSGVYMAVTGEISYSLSGMLMVLGAAACGGMRWALTSCFLTWHANRSAATLPGGPQADTPAPSVIGGPIVTLYTLTPFMSVFLAIASAIIEPQDPRILEGDWALMSVLFAGGFLAFIMLTSEFGLIHNSSVLALSVAGLAKEIVLISSSMLVFGDTLTPRNVLGLLVSMAGIWWYNSYRQTSRSYRRVHDAEEDSDNDDLLADVAVQGESSSIASTRGAGRPGQSPVVGTNGEGGKPRME
ncbi:hypothetical protein AMAG_11761 [Allomyces macrogynus ATCC 38327]|uniref:Sugar phosphate transporter domain-containing protein n=1 Tax=Allomyces macrogynus (strain ATCC 38327) TaxID=578462 RepID=A0A0L0SWC9_ALLM3|nr:hypothetical protein AMAG_11761 [Allomyces macrogynus ATCC 38327]|eukprot:KNE66644.1 hypothetical protein AMAG_11761 [Allomyces macrogynus ATCC 38327]